MSIAGTGEAEMREPGPGRGYIVFAHGSRLAAANEAVVHVARELSERLSTDLVVAAFLEIAVPDLATAVAALAARGAGSIQILPYFLTPGRHLRDDLPRLAAEAADLHGVELEIAEALHGHPQIVEILLDRAREGTG
jgi:sirohydrochlorin cobaltochelatase